GIGAGLHADGQLAQYENGQGSAPSIESCLSAPPRIHPPASLKWRRNAQVFCQCRAAPLGDKRPSSFPPFLDTADKFIVRKLRYSPSFQLVFTAGNLFIGHVMLFDPQALEQFLHETDSLMLWQRNCPSLNFDGTHRQILTRFARESKSQKASTCCQDCGQSSRADLHVNAGTNSFDRTQRPIDFDAHRSYFSTVPLGLRKAFYANERNFYETNL